jgi:hypothetical protein
VNSHPLVRPPLVLTECISHCSIARSFAMPKYVRLADNMKFIHEMFVNLRKVYLKFKHFLKIHMYTSDI